VEQLVASPPKLSAARRELLRLLLAQGSPPVAAAQSEPPLTRLPAGAERPLSLAQERIWLSSRLAGDARGGTTTAATRLAGPLDYAAFQAAVAELIRRHEILRTSFPGELAPRVVVHPFAPPSVPRIDLAHLAPAEQQAAIRRLLTDEANEPFLLDRLPLLRVKLVRLNEQEHLLVTSVHHIITDGWSSGILNGEFAQLYAAFVAGRPSPLAEPALQYADFAAWQRSAAQGPQLKQQLAYWKQQLAGQIPPLELPADRPRSQARSFAGASYAFALPEELARNILALSRDAGATPFVSLLSAFATLVYRLTGQDEMAVGSPVANRNRRELESVVGCFMHPLVLRLRLAGNPTFRELLARVREVCLAAYAHQDVPFELVMREVRPQWDSVHTPLFQILFNVQKAESGRLDLDGLSVAPAELHAPVSALDLSLHVWIGDGQIRGDIDYAADLFGEATIRWLVRGYQSLLESIATDPDRPLSTIPATGRVPSRPVPAALLRPGLTHQRRELLEHLLGVERDDLDLANVASRACDGQQLPCSFGQERLWLVEQIHPGGSIFNQSQSLRLDGPLDVAALRFAGDEIARRHEIMRTGIVATPSGPLQVVHPVAPFNLPLVDLSQLSAAEQDAESRRLLDDLASRPFQLDQPPLVRAVLIRLGPTRHLLGITAHHLASDGWSSRVFRRELASLYEAHTTGRASPLAEVSLQYADFARWQRRSVREAMLQGQLAYWKDRLSGELPRLELPADRPRSNELSVGRNVAFSFALPESLSGELAAHQRDTGATPFMVLLAAFFALLHRYSGQEDILIDTPTSGRTRRELENLIGFFVNSLVLRVDLAGRPTFRELVARVRAACLDAFANQDVPFDQVVSRLALSRDRRGQSLTPVSFMLHETVAKNEELGAGVSIVPGPYDISDEFDLTLVIWQDPAAGHFTGDLQYDPRLFTREAAGRIASHYQTLLAGFLAHPDGSIAELSLVSEEERCLLMERFCRGQAATDVHGDGQPEQLRREHVCVHHLVEAQTARTPDAPAVVLAVPRGLADEADPAQTLSYGELNRRANQLAHLLVSRGVRPESRVAVLVDRGPGALVAILGVLKAGGVFVPLDASYPRERLALLLDDAQPSVVVTLQEYAGDLPLDRSRIVCLDGDAAALASQCASNPASGVTAENAAYVIYTSGSTGRPKGVVVPHRSVVNHNLAAASRFGLTASDRVLQFHSLSFDAAIEEVFPTWLSGAMLVMRGADMILPGADLHHCIRLHGLTVLNLPTAYFHQWMDHAQRDQDAPPEPLRLVIVGGDQVAPQRYVAWRALCGERIRWLNTYGPTETTVISTCDEPAEYPEADGADVPITIGRPIDHTQAYVLDPQLQLAPIGVPGELYLGGRGVARGYHERPDLTAERFVPDLLGDVPAARLYRTGDRARYRPDRIPGPDRPAAQNSWLPRRAGRNRRGAADASGRSRGAGRGAGRGGREAPGRLRGENGRRRGESARAAHLFGRQAARLLGACCARRPRRFPAYSRRQDRPPRAAAAVASATAGGAAPGAANRGPAARRRDLVPGPGIARGGTGRQFLRPGRLFALVIRVALETPCLFWPRDSVDRTLSPAHGRRPGPAPYRGDRASRRAARRDSPAQRKAAPIPEQATHRPRGAAPRGHSCRS
jgi:amino acid adenylation domain-containing protein